MRATYLPDNVEVKYLGATIFELYSPVKTEFLNDKRSVAVGFDGRKWEFSAAGEVQPYEQVGEYAKRLIKDRFTPEMLAAYLDALNIRAFDPDYYLPNGAQATLVEKHGPIAPGAREFWLS